MLRALIFDVDGTLAETEELHRLAFNDAFATAGLGWHWSQTDYHALLKTTGGKERIARYLAEQGGQMDAAQIAALHAAKTARYVALMAQGQIALRPGVADLIVQAQANGIRLAIATTTSLPNVETLSLAVFGKAAAEVFEVIAGGDMAASKKPAPDVYLLALRMLGLAPHQAIALEDSQNGLRAAKAAGLACCVSPGVYTRTDDFGAADLVLAEFSDLGGLSGLREVLEGRNDSNHL